MSNLSAILCTGFTLRSDVGNPVPRRLLIMMGAGQPISWVVGAA